MAHFISESTDEYQYSIEYFPETSSPMSSGSGTNYDFPIWSRCSLIAPWASRSSGHCFLMQVNLPLYPVSRSSLSFNLFVSLSWGCPLQFFKMCRASLGIFHWEIFDSHSVWMNKRPVLFCQVSRKNGKNGQFRIMVNFECIPDLLTIAMAGRVMATLLRYRWFGDCRLPALQWK